jgi:hypothetical protein
MRVTQVINFGLFNYLIWDLSRKWDLDYSQNNLHFRISKHNLTI